jgi:hypothetical protein
LQRIACFEVVAVEEISAMTQQRKIIEHIATRHLALQLTALMACCVQSIATTSAAAAGGTQLSVIYQEVRNASVPSAAATLHRLATRERSVIAGACGAGGTGGGTDGNATDGADNVQILQELGRPERWVRLEWTCEALNLDAQPAGASAELHALEALQVTPVQILRHHELPGVTGTQRAAAWPHSGRAGNVVYEVTHVDIGPGPGVSLADVDDAIRDYISAARTASGNLRAEAWRLNGRANHSTLLLVWTTRAARARFAAGTDTEHFRAKIAPGLGAPYDDRLYRRVD